MVWRVRLTSNGLGLPSRTMVSTTLLPAGPRNGSLASIALIGLPSMAMIRSPARMPAAGVSSIGEITFMLALSGCCCSSTPMPS